MSFAKYIGKALWAAGKYIALDYVVDGGVEKLKKWISGEESPSEEQLRTTLDKIKEQLDNAEYGEEITPLISAANALEKALEDGTVHTAVPPGSPGETAPSMGAAPAGPTNIDYAMAASGLRAQKKYVQLIKEVSGSTGVSPENAERLVVAIRELISIPDAAFRELTARDTSFEEDGAGLGRARRVTRS